jgi:hypothetical protein
MEAHSATTSAASRPFSAGEVSDSHGATIRHVRGELLAAGLADDAEIDAHLATIHAGELDLTLAPLISARGRRPAEHPSTLGEVRIQAGRRGPDFPTEP